MDINHKLDLIQELRKEQERRERNIYKNNYRCIEDEEQLHSMNYSPFVSFRLRLLTALFLFFCFFLMESADIQLGTLTHNDIVSYIDKNLNVQTIISSIK